MSINTDEIRKHINAVTSTNIPAIRAHNLVGDVKALLDEVARLRVELRDAGNDLLDVRGILSPNGYPRRVPMELVPTVAPAVGWLAAELDQARELLAFRDRENAERRAEVERLTDEVERLQESYVASQSAVLYHQTSADLLREHLAAARQGRVWPASATPAPLPRRIPGQSADEVGELPALVQPAPIVDKALRTDGDPS
jgi:hypothetical protein